MCIRDRLNKKYPKEHPRSKWSTYETVRYQYLPLKDLYYDKDHGKENKTKLKGGEIYLNDLLDTTSTYRGIKECEELFHLSLIHIS